MVNRIQPVRSPSFGLGAALIVLFSALPVLAQSGGNLSDVTGAIVTTSDVAGGAFTPQPGGDTETRLVYADPAAQGQINRALSDVTSQLEAVLGAGSSLGDDGPTAGQRQALIDAVSNPAKGVSAAQAERLAAVLEQIWQSQTVSPAQLLEAVAAYNNIVSTADDDYILNLPTLLQQIREVLAPIVRAAL
ncbi:MAG: hypothetical protein QNJ46_26825 [Leptolyngbyaceae cyanobacterium MO_188.B28]|nr:hypothetical protein [Leptolyngbyaceae cyanobacterium MO_188.B28]